MPASPARRLAVAHTEASLGWGGQEIRTLTEASGLAARGHSVSIYAARGARLVAEAPRYGLCVTELPIGSKRPRGMLALAREFDRHGFDVVNAHSSTDAWLAALACAWLRARGRPAPALVRTRHVSIAVPNDPATRWLYRRASVRIVTTGDALRDQLVHDNGVDPARVVSVPTGIDAARFAIRPAAKARAEIGLDPAPAWIGIVATLRSWKGHSYLIDALPRLALAGARLAIVGDGPQRAALEAQVAAAGLSGRVLFAGQRHDVERWLPAFDVFVLPSWANEGVPQSLLQAMMAGIPCVTTAVGAIAEIARDGDTAVVVGARDPAALAAGIDRVLSDRGGAAAMAARAREFVLPRYALSGMLDRMEQVFAEAAAETAR
ncbi:MAG: glycosyltransferase family 4 protein [Proteobacteria bacterium]|nr:glycosyltransferase family 4 protein [Pseudomonadota bacterium]